ncbi:acyl-CoA dehydrogenase family protein [Nocardioides sp. zg-536]|uniref:Acyl-CoA dehydrogenase family protein n=1 Tax=Nocardioides faecalis TaxID=2803858 RepID=A0A939BY08_9ACTN|nr:acyl-CoA dehydrogenase family protein [Nocardioides faecalis]MBM9459853.1 acyl-CoA dehydrogenase family protein [Nocardioides faecalis]MBS4754484.1 acyl-CoA dehydrogenase family protein [Nocardioides faecalis]QVI58908.1 acyl-CoA dehydrogenase family protein [Nocardioides faecalis]
MRWNSERAALKQAATDWATREIAPSIQEWEDAGELPRSLTHAAAKAGMLSVGYAEEFGGDGGDVLDACALQEGLMAAGASGGLLSALYTHGISAPHMIAHGSPYLLEKYVRPTLQGDLIGSLGITEPDGGSDVASLKTRAVRDGDHYVINGAKTYITSAVRGDFVVTAARTGDEGHGGLSLIVVDKDTPGLTVSRSLQKMGWRCSDTAELSYDNVRVPVTNLVGEENHAFYYIAEQFVVERIFLALIGYTTALRCTELAAQYCRERETFGKPVIKNQVVRHKLVEMRRQAEVARTYTLEVAQRHVEGESVIAEACMAKQTAVETAVAVADMAVQLHGGYGYMHGTEVERHYRDARLLPIGGGATEVLTDLSAKLLGYA